MARTRVRTALLVALTGLVLILLPFASSRASELPGAVTGVKIEQATADRYQAVVVDIKFAIPAGAKANDTFSVTLPKSLYAQNQTFPVLAPDGSVVANAVVKNGVVTFTTTDYVEKFSHVTGTAKLQAHFNQNQITPGQSNDFDFTSGGKDFHSPVVINRGTGSTHTAPSKIGFWTNPEDQGSTNATDAVRWKLQSWAGPLTNLEFVDTLGPGQVNDCTSFSVVSSASFQTNGDLKNAKPLGARAVLTCLPTSFTLQVASVKTGEVVQVTYDTTITDQSQKAFTNQVKVTAKGRSRSVGWKLSHYGAYGQGSGTVITTPPTTTAPSTSATTTARTTTQSVLASTTSRTTTAATTTTGTSAGSSGQTTTRTTPVTTAATLPYTGSSTGPLSAIGGVLLLGGSALLLLGRRRGAHAG